MDKDGGLAEYERQQEERLADHEARRARLASGSVPEVEEEETPETKPKKSPRSRARAKSSPKKS